MPRQNLAVNIRAVCGPSRDKVALLLMKGRGLQSARDAE